MYTLILSDDGPPVAGDGEVYQPNPSYIKYLYTDGDWRRFRENGNSYLHDLYYQNERYFIGLKGDEFYFPKRYNEYDDYYLFDQGCYPAGTYYIDAASFNSYRFNDDTDYYMPDYLKLPILKNSSSIGDGQKGIGYSFLKTLEESLPPNFNGAELSLYMEGELQGHVDEILEKIRNKGWTVSENYSW